MTLITGDLLITFVSVYAAIYMHLFNSLAIVQEFSSIFLKALVFAVIVVFMWFFVDLYKNEKSSNRQLMLMKILFAGVSASVVLSSFYFFFPSIGLSREILFESIFISMIFQSIWHIGYSFFLRLPAVADKVLILGTGPVAHKMGDILSENSINGLSLAGYVNCIGEPVNVPSGSVLGSDRGLLATATKERVQKIVISLNERRGTLPVREVLDCKLSGIDVVDGPSFYEQLTGKLLIENMNPSHLIFSEGFRITALRRLIKRFFDLMLAIMGVSLALPLFIIVPVLIKVDSRGPIFFKQDRIGEGEKEFTLYKFRTMVDGAEKESGPVWSRNGDSRITRIGKLLRKMRVDEIPQLLNVIRGDMSFVGPRPERAFFVESLKKQIPYYSERHCIKPGITGWAQVRYQYGDSIEDAIEKLRYDLYYIKYQSNSLDLLIIMDTIKVILSGFGGR